MSLAKYKDAELFLKSKSYECISQIGEGSFGLIYKVKHIQQQKYYAAKVHQKCCIYLIQQIDKNQNQEVWSYIEGEIQIMSTLSKNDVINENILQLIETFQDDEYLYIILELGDRDLSQLWAEFGQLIPEEIVVYIIQQILHGLFAIHSNLILHRDIKLENIIIKQTDQDFQKKNREQNALNATYKIADFGLSKLLSETNKLATTYVGSPYTMAPEIHQEQEYSLAADIYSFGTIIYQMLEGDFPFFETFNTNILDQICQQQIRFQQNVSEEMQDLIRQMLKYKPEERIYWSEIYSHPALNKKTKIYEMFDLIQDEVIKFYESQPIEQRIVTSPDKTLLKSGEIHRLSRIYEKERADSILYSNPQFGQVFVNNLNVSTNIKEQDNEIKQDKEENKEKEESQDILKGSDFEIIGSGVQNKEKPNLEKINLSQLLSDCIKQSKKLNVVANLQVDSEIEILQNLDDQLKNSCFQEIEQISPSSTSQILHKIKKWIWKERNEKKIVNEGHQHENFQQIIRKIFQKADEKIHENRNLRLELLILKIKLLKVWRTFEKDRNETVLQTKPYYYEILIQSSSNEQQQEEYIQQLKDLVKFT